MAKITSREKQISGELIQYSSALRERITQLSIAFLNASGYSASSSYDLQTPDEVANNIVSTVTTLFETILNLDRELQKLTKEVVETQAKLINANNVNDHLGAKCMVLEDQVKRLSTVGFDTDLDYATMVLVSQLENSGLAEATPDADIALTQPLSINLLRSMLQSTVEAWVERRV